MGSWGTGNFDNDTAGDRFLSLIDQMKGEIQKRIDLSVEVPENSGWEDTIPCLVEIITVLSQQDFHPLCLDPEEVKRWKQIFMQRWVEIVAGTWFEDDDRRERERILNETFNKLIVLMENE